MKTLSEKQAFLLFLQHYGVEASLSLGQNFLYEKKVLDQIASHVCTEDFDWIFELGAGTGNLTHALLEKSKKVVSVEIDVKLHDLLRKRFESTPNLELLFEDARTLDYPALLEKQGKNNFAVCGNLPYYITTELILLLCTALYSAKQFIFLVQEEACDRIFVKYGSKSYGPLSIFLSNFFEIERLEKLPAHAFVPAPRVDSRLIRLKTLENAPLNLSKDLWESCCTLAYFQFLKQAFQNRRKKLSHHLKTLAAQKQRNFSAYEEFLLSRGLDLNVRAEALTPVQWLELYLFHLDKEEIYEKEK